MFSLNTLRKLWVGWGVELDGVWVGWEEGGMEYVGDSCETFEEGRGRGIEELVGDAVDLAVADGAEVVPVALGDDAVEGDTVPCSAPGEE